MKTMMSMLCVTGLWLGLWGQPALASDIKVFAAASLKTAMDEVAATWRGADGSTAVMVYAGSPALAKQIIEGAPADVFISADLAWMDELDGRGLIVKSTRRNLLGNTLVLVAPSSSTATADLANPSDLRRLLADGRLSVADVEAVPAGRYAKAALESLGLWDSVKDRLAQTQNVRLALAFVARGEAPLGVVYGSDAVAEPKVRVDAVFPATSHPPIIYPAAAVAGAHEDISQSFLSFLSTPESAAIFVKNGFTTLGTTSP